jgi:hypothetical protein
MFEVNPILFKDGYKVGHKFQYPKDTQFVYSNFTPRKSRTGFNYIINFGLQYYLKEYLRRQWNLNFFGQPKDIVMRQYKRRIDNYLGPNAITYDHIEALWRLGYLPIRIKALPEGTLVPVNVPVLTIRNTKPSEVKLTKDLALGHVLLDQENAKLRLDYITKEAQVVALKRILEIYTSQFDAISREISRRGIESRIIQQGVSE